MLMNVKMNLRGTGHAFNRSGGSNDGQYDAARAGARELGVDKAPDAVDAEDKAAKVRALNARSEHVAMVGCGATDGMTLAEASVGVALLLTQWKRPLTWF